MQQYAICSENFNEVGNHLQECDDDAYDTIAPVTQDIERQDEDEGCTDTHPDLNETFDHLSDNLGIPSTQQNNEPLILNEMPDYEYRGLVQMLNKKQREFFYHALHLIKTSEKPFYAFLSGGGGVGKSHLMKSIYQAALKYYSSRAGEDFRPLCSNTVTCSHWESCVFDKRQHNSQCFWHSSKSVSKELQTIRFWEIKHDEM